MRIVMVNAGLANQTFQYIFARYLEETTGERVLMEDLYFYNRKKSIDEVRNKKPATNNTWVHNGYEIEYVFPNAVKPMLLSSQMSQESLVHAAEHFEADKGICYESVEAKYLLENGMDDLAVVFENISNEAISTYAGRKLLINPYEFNPDVAKIEGDVYFCGYWVISGWLEAYKETMLKELTFRPISDSVNKQYESDIKNSFSVGIHVRRGDFVRLGWATSADKYKNALANLKVPENARYFVFSDDLQWCKDNVDNLGLSKNTVFVEGNFDFKNNYVDMMLMSLCSVLIFGASSFSYLASLLNQREGFVAVPIDESYKAMTLQR